MQNHSLLLLTHFLFQIAQNNLGLSIRSLQTEIYLLNSFVALFFSLLRLCLLCRNRDQTTSVTIWFSTLLRCSQCLVRAFFLEQIHFIAFDTHAHVDQ